MTPPLETDSWVRLPVPLTGLQEVSGDLSNETFAPANSVTITAGLGDDPAVLFKTLPLDDEDVLVTDQVFSKPIEPYALTPVASLRSRTKLRVYAYDYGLSLGVEEPTLQTRALASGIAYPVPVGYAITTAGAATEINDQPPVPPEGLVLVEGSAAPSLGASPVAALSALADYRVHFWAAGATGWDDEESHDITLNDWLTLSATAYYKGMVATNSYLAVPETAAVTYAPSLTSPAAPKLLIAAGDYEARVLASQVGTNYTRVRAEYRPYGSSAATPSLVWEASVYAPLTDGTQFIEVRIGSVVSADLANTALTLASESSAYASATIAANTSYVFVGNAAGSVWLVNTGYHVNNLTGVYAHTVNATSRARLPVVAGSPITAVTRAVLEEKPTAFFSAISFQGSGAAKTISTPGIYPAFVIHRSGATYTNFTYFGASVFNKVGQTNNASGGSPDTPKYSSLGNPFDVDASFTSQGFVEYGPGYYKLGTDTSINANTTGNSNPCTNVFAWVLGGNGKPKLNQDGVAKGGVSTWNVSSNWGFAAFAFTGVPSEDVPATGLAIGHGLRDRAGNRIKPQIVFVKRYFASIYARNTISIAGEILGVSAPSPGDPALIGNYAMKLAMRETVGPDYGKDPKYWMYSTGSSSNFYRPEVADEECVYLNEYGNPGTSATAVGWAFGNVPGACKVGTVTSQGATTQSIVTDFPVRTVIMKCTSATGTWLLFGPQSCLANGAFEINTNITSLQTNVATVAFTGAGFDWTNKLNDAGQEWLYIAIGGYGPDEVIYAAYLAPGSFSSTGIEAGSKRARILRAEAGNVALGGQAAVPAYQRQPLAAESAQVTWTGEDTVLWSGYALDGQPAELTLEGVSAALLRVVIQPLLASGYDLALGGQAATLTGPRDNYWGTWADQNYSWEEAILLEWWGQ